MEVTYPQPRSRFPRGCYSSGNFRPPTNMPNPTPKHRPAATSLTMSDPCTPLRRGLFKPFKSAKIPNIIKKANTLNLRLFTKSLRKVVHRVPLALFLHRGFIKVTQYADSLACFRISTSASRKGVPLVLSRKYFISGRTRKGIIRGAITRPVPLTACCRAKWQSETQVDE
jgi:hypothetical protein